MKLREDYVLPQSNIYFYNAPEQSKKAFFYPLSVGHYFYAPNYHLRRTSYDSFLIMYIISGSCMIVQNTMTYKAHSGQVVLLDCYQPHEYYTTEGWEALWVHYDGVTARNLYSLIYDNNGLVITLKDYYRFYKYLKMIYDTFHNHEIVRDAQLSNYLNNLLTELILNNCMPSDHNHHPEVIDEIITYITENLGQPLSLELLSKRASLSPYYFSRIFKKEVGMPPHEYIISTRINTAKYYLTTTSLSVKEIALSLGFLNESTFCTTFKLREKSTPTEYRIRFGIIATTSDGDSKKTK